MYSPDFQIQDFIERAKNTSLYCKVYSEVNGSLVSPTSGTISIFDANGAAVVSAASVTIDEGTCSYQVSAASVPATMVYQDGWLVQWSLTISGVVHIFENTASLVRVAPKCILNTNILFQHMPSLNPSNKRKLSKDYNIDISNMIKQSWLQICRSLLNSGLKPHMIIDNSRLLDPHISLCKAMIFEDMAAPENDYMETANKYRDEYQRQMSTVQLLIDSNQDSIPDRRRPGRATIWVM